MSNFPASLLCSTCGKWVARVGSGGLCGVCRSLDRLCAFIRGPAIVPELEFEVVNRVRGWIGESQDLSEERRGVVPNPAGARPYNPAAPPEPPVVKREAGSPPAAREPGFALPVEPAGVRPKAAASPPDPAREEPERTAHRRDRSRSRRHPKQARRTPPSSPERPSPESEESECSGDSPGDPPAPAGPEAERDPAPEDRGAERPREPSRSPLARPSSWRGPIPARGRGRHPGPRQGKHFGKNKGRKKRERAHRKAPPLRGGASMPPKLRRPAAAKAVGRRVLHRPARGPVHPPEERVEVIECRNITLDQCRGLKEVAIVEGTYWEQEVEAKSVHLEGADLFLKVKLTGTRSEGLLRTATGLPGQIVRWHLCGEGCRGLPHEEDVIHVRKMRCVDGEKEAWMTNLQGGEHIPPGAEDELGVLRREQEAVRGPHPEGKADVEEQPADHEGATGSSKSKKKKKKKKGMKVESAKGLAEIYKNTGLDPEPKSRKRMRRKAQKLAKKRSKDSSDSSGSSSSSSGESNQDPSLFGASGRVQLIGKKFPGVLLASAAEEAAEALLTSEGTVWDPSTGPVVPVFTRYFRAQLQSRMSPAMAREALTLAYGLDLGLRGRMADLMDLLGQRLKALELQATGSHYTVAQQCELLPKETAAMSTQVEIQQAAKRAREEGKTKQESARPYGTKSLYQGKGDEAPKGGKKGSLRQAPAEQQQEEEQAVSPFSIRVLAPPVAGYSNETPEAPDVRMDGAYGSGIGQVSPSVVLHDRTENSAEDAKSRQAVEEPKPRQEHGVEPQQDPPGEGWKGQPFRALGGPLKRALQHLEEGVHSKTSTTAGDLFPLPLSASALVGPEKQDWLWCVLSALNDLNGVSSNTNAPVSECQKKVVLQLGTRLERFWNWGDVVPGEGFGDLFDVRGVDYRGEEVKLAKSFSWSTVSPSLPLEVGTLELEKFCTGGCLHYVTHFEDYLLPPDQQHLGRVPRVMVSPEDWGEVCEGLIQSKICGVMARSDLYHVGDQPVLNGLFSVSKNEFVGPIEVHRLIMNLVPLNRLCRSFQGDVATLPTMFSSFFLEDGEIAIMASEDIKCFYYLFTLPCSWFKFLGFAGEVPEALKPAHLKGVACHLYARVLPMGFANSVGLAQHVHRNVVRWASPYTPPGTGAERELRRDRPGTVSQEMFRVYLDNWDAVCKVDAHLAQDVTGVPTAHQLSLRHQYSQLALPRHPKKAVEASSVAEIQGAIFDGVAGIAYAKPGKILKYMGLAWEVLIRNAATLRELQVVAGGLVYIAMFRRPLLGCLNSIWNHMETLKVQPPVVRASLPQTVRKELLRFLSLVPLAQMNFRLPMTPAVTASDASSYGGGLSVSTGLTDYGLTALNAPVRGDIPEPFDFIQVLTIGLFDGISALRVAADQLHLPMAGHVSIECNPHAARVTESFFPNTLFYQNVVDIDEDVVADWACQFPTVGVVLVGAGPPCQDVSSLNVDRQGAQRGVRSSLFTHLPRISQLVRRKFPWAQVHDLMENVFSMDGEDRAHMSEGVHMTPYLIDAAGVSLAHRPRLYWISWDLQAEPGVTLDTSVGEGWFTYQPVQLEVKIPVNEFLSPGWQLPAEQKLPTFTTSRPSPRPGRRPAGLHRCRSPTRERWATDAHRFPPYQYKTINCLRHRDGSFRVANVAEREAILGFPVGYTANCVPKQQQKGESYEDIRKTLLGNTWSVQVIVFLLKQLFEPLGLCEPQTLQQAMDQIVPGYGSRLQTVLYRPPLRRAPAVQHPDANLAKRLAQLVSIKGEDLLLQSANEPLVKHHRLRSSIPARLWKWREVAGWSWRGHPEHINQLELRAALTAIRWMILKRKRFNCRCVHLVDSLVVLHALTRGRSSSRKLRRTLSRINSYLLAADLHPLWTYVHTSQNPADRPSRRSAKAAKTKFYRFLNHNKLQLPTKRVALDPLLSEYVEHLWSEGEGRALASDTLAALQDADPHLRGCIPGAWRLLKAWHLHELPNRAAPLPEMALQALAGYFLFHEDSSMALSLLLGYYAMLRTGELLAIQAKDVTVSGDGTSAVVSLGLTKGGKRTGASESVTVTVKEVIRRLEQWKQTVVVVVVVMVFLAVVVAVVVSQVERHE
eukprot:Skav215677  [mRNA]  locus=scaffold278:111881:120662:- [translate_table: standard]